jgi:hypothetical protein
MSEQAFFEYSAKLMSTPHIEEQGEPIHCLIKMEIGAGHRRLRELLKQEARDLILFSVHPGPHRRISHLNICEVDEKRLRELGPATDFNRVGSVEIYFYSSWLRISGRGRSAPVLSLRIFIATVQALRPSISHEHPIRLPPELLQHSCAMAQQHNA